MQQRCEHCMSDELQFIECGEIDKEFQEEYGWEIWGSWEKHECEECEEETMIYQ